MLTRQNIFAQIEEENVDLIWKPVSVCYDNSLQLTVSFWYEARNFEILEPVGAFRDSPCDPSISYLVRTSEGVFSLYLTPTDQDGLGTLTPIPVRWILHSRIRDKEDKDVLVDMKLKRLADFHGHLCPELVIGYRACLIAQEALMVERMWQPRMEVIVENTTSALDAVQMLTGCTTGNGRLKIIDRDKHAYTFIPQGKSGLRVEAKAGAISRSADFIALERLVETGGADLSEITRYWAMVNRQVGTLLGLDDEALFDLRRLCA